MMKYAIGVDLGGTKIEAALVDEEYNVHASHRLATGKGRDILKNLNACISEVDNGEAGVGIGTPGFVRHNKLISNPNVEGLNDALKKFMQENPGAKLENDANCFAIAEHMLGAARGRKNVLGVIWGTGIGGGIIVDGKLHKGLGGAGSIGHIILDNSIDDYGAGSPGTWEYLCSGPNIIRRYREAGGEKDLRPDQVFASEDETCRKVSHETLKYMGMALGSLINVLDPEIIVMGGGVSNSDVYDELNEMTDKYSVSRRSCSVVKNERGDSAGVLGAASLVFQAEASDNRKS